MPSASIRRSNDERGFTLVEVLVAMTLLVVGLFGVVTMVDTANHSAASTLARDAGNTLAREIVERARQVPYHGLTDQTATSQLSAIVPGSTVSAGTWSVNRRKVGYTATVTACDIDDPSDGVGPVDSTFCAPGGGGGSNGWIPPSGSGIGISLQLLGIPVNVAAGGTLIGAICSLLGNSPTLDALLGRGGPADALLKLARSGADIKVCPSSGAGQVALDTDPDDFKRVVAAVSWQGQRTETVRQSTLIPSPGSATG